MRADRTVPLWVGHREADLAAEPTAVYFAVTTIGGRSLEELTGTKNSVRHMTRP